MKEFPTKKTKTYIDTQCTTLYIECVNYKYIDSTNARKDFFTILKDAHATGTTYIVKKSGIPLAKIQKLSYKELDELENKKSKKKKIDLTLFGVLKDDPRDAVEIEKDWREKAWRSN